MRIASPADIDVVTERIALAFAADPTWGPALARPDGSTAHHAAYWRLFAEGAVPHGMVFLSDEDASVAVWIPPGADVPSPSGLNAHDTIATLAEAYAEPARAAGLLR